MNESEIEEIIGAHKAAPESSSIVDELNSKLELRTMDGLSAAYKTSRKHEVNLLAQMARIRYAIGDNGTRDTFALVQYLAVLRKDAELFNSLQELIYDLRDLHERLDKPFHYKVLVAYLAKHKPECVPVWSEERMLSQKQTAEDILAHHINKRKNASVKKS